MKLIIDKGNTRTKVAVYKKEELLSVTAVGRLDIGFIDDLFAKYDIKSSIFSSVSGIETKDVMNYLSETTQLFLMSADLSLPVEVSYLPD